MWLPTLQYHNSGNHRKEAHLNHKSMLRHLSEWQQSHTIHRSRSPRRVSHSRKHVLPNLLDLEGQMAWIWTHTHAQSSISKYKILLQECFAHLRDLLSRACIHSRHIHIALACIRHPHLLSSCMSMNLLLLLHALPAKRQGASSSHIVYHPKHHCACSLTDALVTTRKQHLDQ